MAEPKRIISWSGGKDSTATVILAHEHGIPIDEIVMACLWFDKARGISAITPEHWQFITEVAKPKFEEWGYKVTFVDGAHDYIDIFHRVKYKSKYPEENGKKYGFLVGGFCKMTGVKESVTKKIKNTYQDCINYVGIAADEEERIKRLYDKRNEISLLVEYGIDESHAKQLCAKYGLLSPIYSVGNGAIVRDGCWFCPNARIREMAYIKQNYPELWGELDKLSKEENLSSKRFKYTMTFAEVDAEVDRYIHRPIQHSFWELLDSTQGA